MFRYLSLIVIPAIVLCVRPVFAREVSDFGLMLNDDGDFSFVSTDPQQSVAALEASVDALVGTPVKTLLYSVGCGSDTLYYPTLVANVVGWRKTRSDELADPATSESQMWTKRIAMIRGGMEAGIDPIRVAGQRARQHGLYFLPTYRMNDDHFIFDPLNYPLTGKFWLDNHERLTIGVSPIAADKHYGNLFDFSQPEVREYRLAVIKEIIERYQDISDGIELDFNRVQVLFPPGTASDRSHLITEMLAEVRAMLREAERSTGRKQWLFVRVPPTLENCTWAGIDVATWIKRSLVDVVLPAQLMTLAHDMPVDQFVAVAKDTGCRVYPSLYPRTSFGWDFVAQPTVTSYAASAQREVTPDLVRGAAANYWRMGAAGFQLYNFHHEDWGRRPYSDRLYRIMRDLADPATLNQANKVFAITPAYYLDHEDTYEYRKQIPMLLAPRETTKLTLFVGEHPSHVAEKPRYCGLRLGFAQIEVATELTVTLNEQTIWSGPLEQRVIATSGNHPPHSPGAYVQFELVSFDFLRCGRNELTVKLDGSDNVPIELVEVRLGLLYDREYLKLIE